MYPSTKFTITGPYAKKVFLLKHSLYGLKNAVNIWFKTVLYHFIRFNQMELKRAPYPYYDNELITSCYVSDLLTSIKGVNVINSFKYLLASVFIFRHMTKPEMLLGV